SCLVRVVSFVHSLIVLFCFFFFSSRRRHTRFSRDWSSDVCSSDLYTTTTWSRVFAVDLRTQQVKWTWDPGAVRGQQNGGARFCRSEERRVGKECRSRWLP